MPVSVLRDTQLTVLKIRIWSDSHHLPYICWIQVATLHFPSYIKNYYADNYFTNKPIAKGRFFNNRILHLVLSAAILAVGSLPLELWHRSPEGRRR